MSAVLQTHLGAAGDVNSRLNFQKNLQSVTGRAQSEIDSLLSQENSQITSQSAAVNSSDGGTCFGQYKL